MKMMKRGTLAAIALVAATLAVGSQASAQSDAQKQRLIRQSIANYSGSCPCPYSRDRAGRSCGRRSAYSRPGGASPLCYPSDISSSRARPARARRRAR
jgi:hypothetical protein